MLNNQYPGFVSLKIFPSQFNFKEKSSLFAFQLSDCYKIMHMTWQHVHKNCSNLKILKQIIAKWNFQRIWIVRGTFLMTRAEVPQWGSPYMQKTRATRTPAFWGCLMITHTIESYWIPSQKMTKSKLQIEKIRQNFKFLNFETGITRDTPSEVAW